MITTDYKKLKYQCQTCELDVRCSIKRQAELGCDNAFIRDNFCTKYKKITEEKKDETMSIKFD